MASRSWTTASICFPASEGALVAEVTLLRRFRRYCDELGLSGGVGSAFASSLVCHPSDRRRLGRRCSCSTRWATITPAPQSLYTCVSSDYRIRTLRRVLDATVKDALSFGRGDIVKRQVDYTWRLAELMAAHGMHNSTELIPRLAERGIQLSRPQVYRVVHQRPERISLQLLAALCDIFGLRRRGPHHRHRHRCAPQNRIRRPRGPQPPNVVELNKSVRPRRARVIRDDD